MANAAADESEPVPNDPAAAEESNESSGVNSRIAEEFARQRALVPGLGQGKRWYDHLEHVLETLFTKRPRIWRRLPRGLRGAVNQLHSNLWARNQLARERIGWPNDPIRNIFLPKDEQVQIPAYWVLEFYSPSYISALEHHITTRKWAQGNYMRPSDPMHSVHQAREEDRGGSWELIATFVPTGTNLMAPGGIATRLPPEIAMVQVRHMSMGSALTAIVAAFYLKPAGSDAVDTVLKREHQPRLRKQGRTTQVTERWLAGIADIQSERNRLHQVGREWLAKELPGIFAREASGALPLLDALITADLNPFDPQSDARYRNYSRSLGFGENEWDVFFSPEIPGFRLSEYSPGRRSESTSSLYTWSLAARLRDAYGTKDSFDGYMGGRTCLNVAQRLDDVVGPLLARLAVTALLDVKQRRAAVSRDLAHRQNSHRPVANAKRLKSAVLRNSLDLATIASDITSLAEDKRRYEMNVPTIHRRAGAWDKRATAIKKDILEAWAQNQIEVAAKVLELDRALVQILGVVADLTTSIESIRSQRLVIVVGVLSLAAAVAAVWIAIHPIR